MKIAVQTGGMRGRLGIDGTYKLMKEAGFDAADVNLDNLFGGGSIRRKERSAVFDGPEEELFAAVQPYKDAAEKYGIDNFQAHAPFPSAIPNEPEYNEYLIEILKKTVKAAAYIGVKKLIVHPFFYGYGVRLSPEEEWEQNIRSYSALIPDAKKYGVTICLENMFCSFRGKIYGSCCSDITEACRYVDELNRIAGEKVFGFCLDTGHILLAGLDIYDTIVELGDRIEAFHVHDNNGVDDQHLPPYMGVLDWNRFIAALAAIRYTSTMDFETFNLWGVYDPEIAPDAMVLLAKIGRMFDRRANELMQSQA